MTTAPGSKAYPEPDDWLEQYAFRRGLAPEDAAERIVRHYRFALTAISEGRHVEAMQVLESDRPCHGDNVLVVTTHRVVAS